MTAFARSSLVLLAAAAALIFALDLLGPGERGTVDAELVVTAIGALAVVQLLVAAGRRWPHVWRPGTPWWHVRLRHRGDRGRHPDAVREWDALLVTAATGEQRGRDRLCRRLDTLAVPGTDPLLAELRRSPSAQVLDLVERFTDEVERTHAD